MKTTIPIYLLGLMLMTACDHTAILGTRLNEDGSLVKSIEIPEAEESITESNYFGISAEQGWDIETEPVQENAKKVNVTFTREFDSVNEFNEVMNRPVDSLFRVEARFDRKFRWFYTYLNYSETFKAADRLTRVDQKDFFTLEEYAFIERLPARGEPISRADSLFAEALNKKILDVYAVRGIYEEIFTFFESRVETYNMDPVWKDSLSRHKENMYACLLEDNQDGLDDDVFLEMMDSLNIPFPHPQIDNDYYAKLEEIDHTLNFMSWVTDGTYINHIEVPWNIVSSNAHEMQGNVLSWNPPTIKLLLQDYTMNVTTRKLNYWAVAVTLVFMFGGAFILFRRHLPGRST